MDKRKSIQVDEDTWLLARHLALESRLTVRAVVAQSLAFTASQRQGALVRPPAPVMIQPTGYDVVVTSASGERIPTVPAQPCRHCGQTAGHRPTCVRATVRIG